MDILRLKVFKNNSVTISCLKLLLLTTVGQTYDAPYNDTESSTGFYCSFRGKNFQDFSGPFTECKASNFNLLELRDSLVQTGFKKYSDDVLKNYGNSMTFITGLQRFDFEKWSWLSESPDSTFFNQSKITNFDSGGWSSYLDCSQAPCVYKVNADMSITRSFICMDTETCNENTNKMIVSNHCYELGNKLVSWFEARNACFDRKGDLAQYIDSVDDQWKSGNPSGFWVGLVKSRWYWMQYDGGKVEAGFTNWNGNPSDASGCTVVRWSSSPKWTASPCDGFYYVICTQMYARPNTTTVTKPSTLISSGTTPADSTTRTTDLSKKTPISSTTTIDMTTTPIQTHSSVVTEEEQKIADIMPYIVSGVTVGFGLLVVITSLVYFFIRRRNKNRSNPPVEAIYDNASVSLPFPYMTQSRAENIRSLPALPLQRNQRVQSLFADSQMAHRLYSNINRDSFVEAVFSEEDEQTANEKLEKIPESTIEREPRYVTPHIAKRPVTSV